MALPKLLSDKDWEKIELYMKAGASQARVAESFNISHETLRKRFKEKYGEDYKNVNESLRRTGELLIEATQFQKALAGNTQLLIWLGKVRCSQKEPEFTPTVAPLQDDIDKDHVIMQLRYKLDRLKNLLGKDGEAFKGELGQTENKS